MLVTGFALAALVVGAVLTLSKPLAIALMAMPALFLAQRAGFGGGDVSVSDVALVAAFGTAVLLGHRPYSRELRAMLWFNLGYQFATLITVIVNPFAQNVIEWFHAWLLITGASSSAGPSGAPVTRSGRSPRCWSPAACSRPAR